MEFVIITGMSGAGKTSALRVLEDIGYYCVDNIPAALLSTLYTLCSKSGGTDMSHVAVVVDVRGTENYDNTNSELEEFKKAHENVKILFFDAQTEQIIIRYKETRRRHPLADRLKGGSVMEAVEFEKALLASSKRLADYTIDTSFMANRQLRERIMSIFMEDPSKALKLTFISFGFKYGIPLEADLIIDVRCLPNPFYIPALKPLSGMDKAVRDYVLGSDETQEFVRRTLSLLDFSVPLYLKEGKSELVAGIGCTGSKHRSVTVARTLQEHFQGLGYRCVIKHRDVARLS